MKQFTIHRTIAAPAEKAWPFASDFLRSPGPGVEITVEVAGSGPDGVGTERTITIGSVKVRERLESVGPGMQFTYKILSGAPMKQHQATATFTPNGTSTEARWDVELLPKVPGMGWILAMVTRKAVNQYLDAVERAATQ